MQIQSFFSQTFQVVKQTIHRVLTPQQQQIICAIALEAFSCLSAAYLALRYDCNKISLIDKTTIDAEIDETTIDAGFEKGLNKWSNLENQLNSDNSFNTEKAANKIREAYYGKQSGLDLANLRLKSLPEEIGKLTHLKVLNLSGNRIQQLPESFGQLTQLQDLSLLINKIQMLPESFGQLTQLKTLNLWGNRIQQLPESFGQLTQLKILKLSENQIQQLPESFGQLTQLTKLSLSGNGIQQLPELFGQLTQLQDLYLANNQIKQLPESFGQLTQLQSLDLAYNHIQIFPESFGHLQQLSSLNLDENPIHSLPMSLGQCRNLTSISCDSTSVPEETINAILAMCQALRAKDAVKILPERLNAWQTFAKQQFKLSFIEGMSEKEKQTINEWLTRLERTSDFNRPVIQEKLAKSACQMLASLAQSPSFKEIFFIQVPQNLVACGDRAAMSFNELGIAWTCDTLNLSAISAKDKLNTLIQAAKTLTLHKSLQKRIEVEEKKQGAVIKEAVEIFLYYETHLKDTLNLLTFMSDMLYSIVGKRDWIHEANLVEEVNTNYRECLLDQPALLVLCQADPKFKADWQTIEDSLYKKIENLDPTLLGEGNYKLQTDLLKQEFETQKRALMLQWVEKLT